MKFGCFFLFAAFLFINFQASDAVKCFGRSEKCSQCVFYNCEKTIGMETGCPEDFFKACSDQIAAVNFVKSKNYNDLEYGSKENKVLYISGCGNEEVGVQCMVSKVNTINERLARNEADFCYEAGNPCNNSNSQNAALKLIGILGIGWMIFAWIF